MSVVILDKEDVKPCPVISSVLAVPVAILPKLDVKLKAGVK